MSVYTHFDAIYCITLRPNIVRQRSSKRIADMLGIPLRFYYADKHPRGGMVGCFMSHIAVISEMYKNGTKYGLIFEDDFVPTDGYSETIMTEVVDFMKSHSFDTIQLGVFPMRRPTDFMFLIPYLTASRVSHHIIEYSALTTHAYIISRTGMQKVLEAFGRLQNIADHIDIWYGDVLQKRYSVIPIQFDQRWCLDSDNQANSFLERTMFRPYQCLLEKYKLSYWISLLPLYRHYVIVVLLICLIRYSTATLPTSNVGGRILRVLRGKR